MSKLIKWENLVKFANLFLGIFAVALIMQIYLGFTLVFLGQNKTLKTFESKYLEVFSEYGGFFSNKGTFGLKADLTPSIIFALITSLILIYPLILLEKAKNYPGVKQTTTFRKLV